MNIGVLRERGPFDRRVALTPAVVRRLTASRHTVWVESGAGEGAMFSNDEYLRAGARLGYSPAEVVVKEVLEETGIECEPIRLIAVLDGQRMGFTRIPLYSLVFHCRATGGSLAAHPLECADVGWFAEDAMPTPLAGIDRWGEQAFAAIRGEPIEVLFDAPRPDVWRS